MNLESLPRLTHVRSKASKANDYLAGIQLIFNGGLKSPEFDADPSNGRPWKTYVVMSVAPVAAICNMIGGLFISQIKFLNSDMKQYTVTDKMVDEYDRLVGLN